MSFDTIAGTRGARQPSGRIARWFNALMARRVRRTSKFMGMDTLVLTTVGRKTGAQRAVPIAYFPGPDGTYHVVASAAGAAGNPDWYRNLAAHPGQARIDVGGRSIEVTARQLHGDERAEAWEQVVRASPRFGGYQLKTDRELPVVRLTPRAGH